MAETVTETTRQDAVDRFAGTGVRRLTRENVKLFEGSFDTLHCHVAGEPELYRGVWAVLLFPITHPDSFISLRYTDVEDKDQEVGVIMDLASFPAETRELIRRAVVKQYYQQPIRRIYAIACRHSVLFFDVETDFGRSEFVMPWRYDRAEDFGARGKVLLDSLDNRYVIPDVDALPPVDKRVFLNYIYW